MKTNDRRQIFKGRVTQGKRQPPQSHPLHGRPEAVWTEDRQASRDHPATEVLQETILQEESNTGDRQRHHNITSMEDLSQGGQTGFERSSTQKGPTADEIFKDPQKRNQAEGERRAKLVMRFQLRQRLKAVKNKARETDRQVSKAP